MDTSLFFLINQGLQNALFDVIMPFITKRSYILFILIMIPAFFNDRKKSLVAVSLSLIAFALGDGSANMLKHLFEKPRPCQTLENVRLLVGCTGSFAMPSNHAVNAFAIAAAFSHFFRKAAVPMFFVAILVAFSRIYVGVHYPSDVIAGAVWGGVVAGFVLILHKWSSVRVKKKPFSTIFLLLLLGLTFFRYYYIVTGPLDLSPDEAHYWEWSRRLDLSYYSKGPAIAYLIAFTTWLFGDTVFGVRFFAPIFLALSSIIIYKLTQGLFSEGDDGKSACIAGLLPQITPLFATYGVVMTIDSPFIFFWTLSLYLFWKATKQLTGNTGQLSVNGIYWILLGFSLGFGLLTKYTMAFFYICAFLFLVFSKEQRKWFKKKEPYRALLISLLVFGPVIVWNAAHDWVTLKHTAGQAHIADGLIISSKYFFEFIGSQIGVITPLLFFLVIYGAIRNYVLRVTLNLQRQIPPHPPLIKGGEGDFYSSRFLFWFWAPILVFFLLKSLHGKVQANWAMPAYTTAFIASAAFFLKETIINKKGIKILLGVSLITAFLATMISHYPAILNLPVKMDPSSRLRGWKEIGIKAGEIRNSMKSSGSKNIFVFSDKYQVSSELAFYMPDKPMTHYVNLGSRMNQYDIWGGLETLVDFDAIFVRIDNENFPEELKNAFASYEKEKFTVYVKDKILRKYFIFRCYGFKGFQIGSYEGY